MRRRRQAARTCADFFERAEAHFPFEGAIAGILSKGKRTLMQRRERRQCMWSTTDNHNGCRLVINSSVVYDRIDGGVTHVAWLWPSALARHVFLPEHLDGTCRCLLGARKPSGGAAEVLAVCWSGVQLARKRRAVTWRQKRRGWVLVNIVCNASHSKRPAHSRHLAASAYRHARSPNARTSAYPPPTREARRM